MKVINAPAARSVRIAGVEIIDSVKAVASVFTEILLFMVWFRQLSMGFIVLLSFCGMIP